MESGEEEGVTVALVVEAVAEAGGPRDGSLGMNMEGGWTGLGIELIGRAHGDACCR